MHFFSLLEFTLLPVRKLKFYLFIIGKLLLIVQPISLEPKDDLPK